MSDSETEMNEQALLAALALVRQAVDYSDADEPAGDVMDVLGPYFSRAWEMAGSPPEGHDGEPGIRALLAALAQFAGVSYSALLSYRRGRELAKAEVLAALDEYEHALVCDPPPAGS